MNLIPIYKVVPLIQAVASGNMSPDDWVEDGDENAVVLMLGDEIIGLQNDPAQDRVKWGIKHAAEDLNIRTPQVKKFAMFYQDPTELTVHYPTYYTQEGGEVVDDVGEPVFHYAGVATF